MKKFIRLPRKVKKKRKAKGLLTNMKVLKIIDSRLVLALPSVLLYLAYTKNYQWKT